MGNLAGAPPNFGMGSAKWDRYKVVEDAAEDERFWIYDINHTPAQPLPTPYPTREEADAVCKLLNAGEEI